MDAFLSECVVPVLKFLKDSVWKHLCFVVEVGGSVESLGRRAKKLETKRMDVLERIQADQPLGKKPTNEVEEWLSDAGAVLERARSIGEEYGRRNCLFPGPSGCSFNCFSNHHIGRMAADELSNVEDALRFFDGVTEITTEAPRSSAQEMAAAPLTEGGGDDGVDRKVELALDFLRDDARCAMGLWGMGGVGKTTILKRVNNALAKDPLGFHHVVFLTASRDCTAEKIRELLKKELGLSASGGARIFGYLSSKIWKI